MIKINDVTYKYPGAETPAVDSLSLEINEGERLCVLGANGSGKSTLAKMLCGIILPDEGEVIVDGKSTQSEENILDIRRSVGMVFQNPDNQIVATVVEEDVAFALENLGVPREEMKQRIVEAMEATGTLKYAKREPHHLSGGQKQRVAIAGVLAMNPKYLVLDEATAMLDPKGRESVLKTASRLGKDFGMTVIQITHYMEETVEADRIVVMSSGKIVLSGTPKEVFADSELIKKYRLRPPAMKSFFDELRRNGLDLEGDTLTVEEATEALFELIVKSEK